MVMRSFKMANLYKEVGKEKGEEFKKEILKRFGGKITASCDGEKIIIEGEGLADYRIFDALTFIITEGKHGKDL